MAHYRPFWCSIVPLETFSSDPKKEVRKMLKNLPIFLIFLFFFYYYYYIFVLIKKKYENKENIKHHQNMQNHKNLEEKISNVLWFFISFLSSSFVTLRGPSPPPSCILKQGGLESSGGRLISSIGKTKMIAFVSSSFRGKKNIFKIFIFFEKKGFSLNWPHWADSVIESPCLCVCAIWCSLFRPLIGLQVT